jgi:hypothetical protein
MSFYHIILTAFLEARPMQLLVPRIRRPEPLRHDLVSIINESKLLPFFAYVLKLRKSFQSKNPILVSIEVWREGGHGGGTYIFFLICSACLLFSMILVIGTDLSVPKTRLVRFAHPLLLIANGASSKPIKGNSKIGRFYSEFYLAAAISAASDSVGLRLLF